MIRSIDESPEFKSGTLQEFLDSKEYPNQVCKYRMWSDVFHKRILTDLEIYMASPKDFQDPNDCRNYVRYDCLNESDFLTVLRDFVKRTSPKWNFEARERLVKELLASNQLKDGAYIEKMAADTFEGWSQHIGILSLSINPNNDRMWMEYSDDDKGFCVVFNSEEFLPFVGGGGPVKYVQKLPVILPEPFMSSDDHIRFHIYYKEDKWCFEEEYRTLTVRPNPLHSFQRKRIISPASYSKVILGRHCSDMHADEIRNSILQNIGEIKDEQKDKHGRTHLLVNSLSD